MAKILIIDDDVDLVEVMRLTLENANHEVIDAQNGTTGFDLLLSEQPDLIILDVMMTTVHEGFDVAQKIRNTPQIANKPIIMLSAIGHETGFKFQKDNGLIPVDEFLEKPIMPDDLINIIKKYVS